MYGISAVLAKAFPLGTIENPIQRVIAREKKPHRVCELVFVGVAFRLTEEDFKIFGLMKIPFNNASCAAKACA